MPFSMNALDPKYHAPEAPPLPVDMLRRGIDDAVGAERERVLPERRREHVVDDELRSAFARDRGDAGDVDEVEVGVGRALQEEDLGLAPHRSEEHTSELQSRQYLVC